MSINNFFNKIKDILHIDRYQFICSIIIILVGVASFGLGRLSTQNKVEGDSNIIFTERNETITPKNRPENKRYVASKNGKLFYSLNCTRASKILKKNAVWFGTIKEATESGYKKSSSCS